MTPNVVFSNFEEEPSHFISSGSGARENNIDVFGEIIPKSALTFDSTTFKYPRVEPEKVISGSIISSPTVWSFLEKLISGDIKIDWRNSWVILRSLIIIIYVLFIGLLYFRDNELGRLETTQGFINFFLKIGMLGVLLLIIVLLISFIVSRFDRSKKK